MFKMHGFTLIELMAVIVIVSVVGITAATRFLSIQTEARIAVLQGARAALETANTQVYTKAILQNQENIDATGRPNIDLDNDGRADLIGYFGLIKYVMPARELAGLDPQLTIHKWYGVDDPSEPFFLIGFANKPVGPTHRCYVEVFYPSIAGGEVTYQLQTAHC
ncbi:prepilin-type N-terminal cleavage/methylation domain-containing protein [Vibrio sp. IRLE0018]|uniref:prepilin-type N-terminal cleavage/methylation domain-containing protein n=1 Tax=Vibrio floridensis TaxID=2908007 RepID=UPI001F391F69|nr:prepilin-type N-terminal cleavage/methylation domain-containing protein [Vibrio floridensis]MCF8778291.1 prepilin-type N-terminal cleavage/methylation domain-containing protein [Vibrio floridensis]